MGDDALNAHLDRMDACAKEQETDYETWLEGRVALLESELAKYHSDWGMGPALLLSNLATLQNQLSVAMSENQRLTKHVEDYEAENANLVERSNRAMTRAIQAEAKLTAIECAGCGKTMLECACDE